MLSVVLNGLVLHSSIMTRHRNFDRFDAHGLLMSHNRR